MICGLYNLVRPHDTDIFSPFNVEFYGGWYNCGCLYGCNRGDYIKGARSETSRRDCQDIQGLECNCGEPHINGSWVIGTRNNPLRIETAAGDFYSGELGPSTIVGSAAFNLFVIIAVCIVAIPAGNDPSKVRSGVCAFYLMIHNVLQVKEVGIEFRNAFCMFTYNFNMIKLTF